MCRPKRFGGRVISGSLRRNLYNTVTSKRLLGYVRSFQAACGVSEAGRVGNAPLHALFTAASALGDEAFYTVALPLCAWVLDLELSRRLAFFWASTYYTGQAAKEVFRLPRPPAPVVRLEHRYSAEYGLPSTHTMGSLIPLFLVACHSRRGSGSGSSGCDGNDCSLLEGGAADVVGESSYPTAGVLLWACLAWSSAIATSRLYMGVHSIPDVLAGYLLGGFLLTFWLASGDAVDAFIVGNPMAWLVVLGGAGGAILAYPCPKRWTNSFGDTVIIVATAAGFLEACCLLHRGGRGGGGGNGDVTLQVLQGVHLLSSGRADGYGWGALLGDGRRCGVGFLVLLPMRSALKLVFRGALSAVLARSPSWPKGETPRRNLVDIPSKVVVYGCMGFSSCYLVPRLWLYFGLEKE
ncbi:unnamed protein product [Ectocarpus sp. 12 AP-2014]